MGSSQANSLNNGFILLCTLLKKNYLHTTITLSKNQSPPPARAPAAWSQLAGAGIEINPQSIYDLERPGPPRRAAAEEDNGGGGGTSDEDPPRRSASRQAATRAAPSCRRATEEKNGRGAAAAEEPLRRAGHRAAAPSRRAYLGRATRRRASAWRGLGRGPAPPPAAGPRPRHALCPGCSAAPACPAWSSRPLAALEDARAKRRPCHECE